MFGTLCPHIDLVSPGPTKVYVFLGLCSFSSAYLDPGRNPGDPGNVSFATGQTKYQHFGSGQKSGGSGERVFCDTSNEILTFWIRAEIREPCLLMCQAIFCDKSNEISTFWIRSEIRGIRGTCLLRQVKGNINIGSREKSGHRVFSP